MLRSLDPETNHESPKPRKKMNAGELHYVEVKAPARERELWRSRARARAKGAALDMAADALARQAAKEAQK
jgi:ribosome-associated translation inhibitor RaiA